jgi:hypothetical protein
MPNFPTLMFPAAKAEVRKLPTRGLALWLTDEIPSELRVLHSNEHRAHLLLSYEKEAKRLLFLRSFIPRPSQPAQNKPPPRCLPPVKSLGAAQNKSLFASFSSEKEAFFVFSKVVSSSRTHAMLLGAPA